MNLEGIMLSEIKLNRQRRLISLHLHVGAKERKGTAQKQTGGYREQTEGCQMGGGWGAG